MWVLKIFRLVLAVMESRDGYNKGVASSPGVTSAVIICEAKMINMLNKQELKDKKKMVILLWSVPAYTFNVIYTYFKSLGIRASEVRAFNRTSKKMFCNHRLMLFLMCPQGVNRYEIALKITAAKTRTRLMNHRIKWGDRCWRS